MPQAKVIRSKSPKAPATKSVTLPPARKSPIIAKAKAGRKAQLPKPTPPKGLSAPIYDIAGKKQGSFKLPKEVFGAKPNQKLIAQAVRVYLANQSTHAASTKTRSEVRGGGAKPWRQKGTGRARAGSTRSPLWVGGGVALGPKPKNTKLTLSKKMRRKALAGALSAKNVDGAVKIISNFEKLAPKTKQAKNLLDKLETYGKTLIILEDIKPNVKLATRNIPDVHIGLIPNLNAHEVLAHNNLLFSKAAVEKMT